MSGLHISFSEKFWRHCFCRDLLLGLLTFSIAAGCTMNLEVKSVADPGAAHPVQDPDPSLQYDPAVHGGWAHVKALGGRNPSAHAIVNGLAVVSPSVYLEWRAMTSGYGVVDSYTIFRSTTAGGHDFTSPYAEGISDLFFEDTNIDVENVYYYVVRPVVDGKLLRTLASDTQVKIAVPPANMALVHRWIANQEMCGLMGKAIDRDNNYRCDYTGPGGTGTHFDLSQDLFVDQVEIGCHFTPSNCGGDDCIGTGLPNSVEGSINDVYYNRSAGYCYIKTAPSTWTRADDAGLSAAQLATLASNRPGLPPVLWSTQSRAWEICQSLTGSSFASGKKRLLRRREFVAAASWDESLDDAAIANIEDGPADHNINPYCNSSDGAGLVFHDDYALADPDTLAWDADPYKFLRTGSLATRDCVSRYGIQDMVGNVFEWNSDQCEFAGGSICNQPASPLDSGATSLIGWQVPLVSTGTLQSRAADFLIPLGLPWVSSADGTASTGSIDLHGDYMWIQNVSIRGVDSGGDRNSQSDGGRFTVGFYDHPTNADVNTGLRCAAVSAL